MEIGFVNGIACLLAYLLGSISFAVLISRAMGLADPRSYGSGNPGATNVLRSGNKAAALATLVGDAAKGWVAVTVAQRVGPEWGLEWALESGLDATAVALVGLFAFLGHLFPVFLKFRGGKGVATAAGVLLGLNLWLGLGTLATWLLIAAFFRLSSLAAIISAVFAPLWAWLLFGRQPVVLIVAVIGALLIARHRTNLAKLLAGTEGRIGEKKAPEPGPSAAGEG